MDPMALMKVTDTLLRALLKFIAIMGVLLAWAVGQLVHVALALFLVVAVVSGVRVLMRLRKS
jgi:hypothetical protein